MPALAVVPGQLGRPGRALRAASRSPSLLPSRCLWWHARLYGMVFTNIGHMAPCTPPPCPKCVSPSGLPGSRPTRLQPAEKSLSGGRHRHPASQGSCLTAGVRLSPHPPRRPPRVGAYGDARADLRACLGWPGPASADLAAFPQLPG